MMQVRVFFRSKLAWVKSSKARHEKHVATDTGSLTPYTSLLDLCISHTHCSSSPEYYVYITTTLPMYIDLIYSYLTTHINTLTIYILYLSLFSVSRLGFGVSHYEGGGGG